MSKTQLHTGYPVCQRVLAFLESPVLLQISLRHFIQTCFTFLIPFNFFLKKEIFLRTENSTLVYLYLNSSVPLVFFFCHSSFLFPGGFEKKTNLCARVALNLNVSHFKKSHCVQIAKHVIFSGRLL